MRQESLVSRKSCIAIALCFYICGTVVTYLTMADRRRLHAPRREDSLPYVESVGPYDVFRSELDNTDVLLFLHTQKDFFANLPLDSVDNHASIGTWAADWFRVFRRNGNRLTTARAVRAGNQAGEQIWDLDGDGRFDLLDTCNDQAFLRFGETWKRGNKVAIPPGHAADRVWKMEDSENSVVFRDGNWITQNE